MRTAWFMKAHTREEEEASKTLRIFVCQFTNTAILVMLVKSPIEPFASIPGEHYDHVNSKWYAQVGSPMVITLLTQFLAPPATHLIMHFVVGKLLRWNAQRSGKIVTQNQLNANQAPGERDLAAGYGEMLLAMSVTLVYGPGMPLLYWVAAGGFSLRLLVERYCDLRIYKRPPLFSKALMSSFDEVLMVVATMHTLLSAYFLAPSKHFVLKHVEGGQTI